MNRVVIYIGNQLAPRGLNPTSVDFLGDKLAEIGTVVKASPYRNMALRLIHMTWIIWQNRTKADVVLIDTYSTRAFNFATHCAGLAKRFGIPYIPILHGGNMAARYERSPERAAEYLRSAARVVSPSPFLARLTKEAFDVRCTVIPNPLDDNAYTFAKRTLTGSVELLWLRALQDIYNPAMALRTVRALLEAGQVVRLHMVGGDKGGQLDELKQQAIALGIGDQLIFHGQLKRQEWTAIAERCTAFINTSNIDNAPVSVIEAMAVGLPVVSTNVGGMPDLLAQRQNALLVDKDDHEAMCAAIIELHSEPSLYNTLVQNGQHKAAENGWVRVKLKWIKLLDEIKDTLRR